MLENKLKKDLETIFGVKATYDAASPEAREQDKLFVELETPFSNFVDGKVNMRVSGTAKIFAENNKIPINFFAAAVARADHDFVKNFFFSEMDENTTLFRNLVQRSFSFVYFFSGQHDPDLGSIESIKTEVITP